MALKITCPHCGNPRRLTPPYPVPGSEVHCESCARTLSITYPVGMVERMRAKGLNFVGEAPPPRPPPPPPPQSISRTAQPINAAALAPRPAGPERTEPLPGLAAPGAGGLRVEQGPRPELLHAREESTAPLRIPLEVLTGEVTGPTAPAMTPPPPPAVPNPSPLSRRSAVGADEVTSVSMGMPPIEGGLGRRERPIEATAPMPPRETEAPPRPEPTMRTEPMRPQVEPPPPAVESPPPVRPPPVAKAPAPAKVRRKSWLLRAAIGLFVLSMLGALAGVGALAGAFAYYGRELPTVEALGQYRPPTVTVVYDDQGRLLGEIYEKRRYVVPLEQIPVPVQNAFIASEDANFWNHGGVDYEGILRAVGRNFAKGRKAQGASTITMQVARNFLLTNEKTYARKIKEIILSHRIEEAFDKKHILYLYLNQIYLGSGAYGVEAAARTYFGKHVQELTLSEAAILAGLPQRPSEYSPHRAWEKARVRQEYVLGQLRDKGYITATEEQRALAEPVNIIERTNEFLLQAPYFTEHIRRYLVDTYGFEKVYNDGLVVDSTCNLDLQKLAQTSLVEGVEHADRRIGWRGPVRQIDPSEIAAWRETQEKKLREEDARATLVVGEPGQGGYAPLPTASTLQKDRIYEGVVVDVAAKHAVVGIGAHQALVPLSWTSWAYKPDPDRSYKGRSLGDLSAALSRGDVVMVRVEALDSEEVENLKGYSAAGPGPFAAARLYQKPDLQGALLAYRIADGAVVSMVGGTDYEGSEYNRATQAQRQVGSTLKPIVYAAAIGTRKFTAGSIVQDAPTVYATTGQKLWKPGNYGEDYLGNITLRRALQMSRNVCTIRVLDEVGLDPVFDLGGRKLRIGYPSPKCSRTHVPREEADRTCKGAVTDSKISGMAWCEYCEPESCPLINLDLMETPPDGSPAKVYCQDEEQDIGGQRWCHSCDVNLRMCDWLPQEDIPSGDRCTDARQDEKGKVWCRSCDLSVGLGSSSLTMVELTRAYSAFATYGKLVEPHWINRVRDRDGTIIEEWKPPEGGWPQVMDAGTAAVGHWLLTEVATGGTAAKSNALGIPVAGKTGTTNDFHDTWFVGYSPKIMAAVWMGYDQPRSMGVSFTGGDISLPVWMNFMKVAAPKGQAGAFAPLPGVEMVPVDESTGRVATGGRAMPMLPGTAPSGSVGEVGQNTTEDLLTGDF